MCIYMTEKERKRQRDTYLLSETEKVRKILENLVQGRHMIKIIFFTSEPGRRSYKDTKAYRCLIDKSQVLGCKAERFKISLNKFTVYQS